MKGFTVIAKDLSCLGFLVIVLCASSTIHAQEKRHMLRDTLDNKIDFSRFIVEAHGFLPVVMIITEPALGGIGVALAPMFLEPKKSTSPSGKYSPPDITMPLAMYTGNDSWMLGAFRIGSIPKARIKYRAGIGYGDINLDFYRTIAGPERSFAFGIKSLAAFGMISKKIKRHDMYVGVSYLYMNTDLSPRFQGEVPAFISDIEMDNHTATAGLLLDWDKRNTIFTPDNGFRLNIKFGVDDEWTGSDFSYSRVNASLISFVPFQDSWVGGFRVEWQHVFDDPPFYLEPGINMRGIPAARYQGLTTLILETEQRYDFTQRWSGLVFGGLAKAVPEEKSFDEAETIFSIGGGFRYLLARLFKIRAGIDLAWGPASFGYYIVFGHSWNR